MEVERERTARKSWMKDLQRQVREFEKFTDLDPNFREKQKESWEEVAGG